MCMQVCMPCSCTFRTLSVYIVGREAGRSTQKLHDSAALVHDRPRHNRKRRYSVSSGQAIGHSHTIRPLTSCPSFFVASSEVCSLLRLAPRPLLTSFLAVMTCPP